MMPRFTLLPLALAVSSAAYANTSAPAADVVELDKQIVSATRHSDNINTLPYTVQIIDQQQLQTQAVAGLDLGGMLGNLVPGLAPGDNSVSSFYQSLRGRNVLVLIDGVAQRANRNISRQLTSISPASVERIEVISGASAIYGAGATGGVINIITKKGADGEVQFETAAGLTSSTEDTGSDNLSYQLEQNIRGKKGDFDYNFNASYEQRGHFIDADGEQIATDPNQVSRDNSNTLDLLFNGGWQINNDQRLSISLNHFNDEMDTDYAADFGDPTAASLGLPQGLTGRGGLYTPTPRKGLSLSDQPKTERQSITFNFSDDDFFGQQLNSQLNYRQNDVYFYPYPGVPLFLNANWQNVASVVTPTQLQTWQGEAVAAGATDAAAVQQFVLAQVGQTIFANAAPSATITQSRVETSAIDIKLALTSELEFNNTLLQLTYGLDASHDEGSQTSIEYNYADWLASGQTQYNATGNEYDAGPDAQTDSYALFLQSAWQPTERLTLRAGIRQEWITTEVDDYLSGEDQINADYYQQVATDASLAQIATMLGQTPEAFLQLATDTLAQQADFDRFLKYSDTAVVREGDKESYSATLLNAGVIYQLTQAQGNSQEVYFNYGEGFTTPDMTRLLRSVSIFSDVSAPGPILEGVNIDAISTDSYDLGWRGQFDSISAQASVFYNESDKNVQFDSFSGVVTIVDQKEQVWGFEGLLDAYLTDNFSAGASYAYTTGQTRDEEANRWIALGPDRISPQKFTSYLSYTEHGKYSVRLQLLHLADYLEGHEEEIVEEGSSNNVVPFQGYTTADLLTNVQLGQGTASLAIRNLTNEEYMPLYNQVRGYPSLGASAYLPAQGRTLSLGYRLAY